MSFLSWRRCHSLWSSSYFKFFLLIYDCKLKICFLFQALLIQIVLTSIKDIYYGDDHCTICCLIFWSYGSAALLIIRLVAISFLNESSLAREVSSFNFLPLSSCFKSVLLGFEICSPIIVSDYAISYKTVITYFFPMLFLFADFYPSLLHYEWIWYLFNFI